MDKALELLTRALSEVQAMSVDEYNELFNQALSKKDTSFSMYEISDTGKIENITSSMISSSQLLEKLVIKNCDNQNHYEYSSKHTEYLCSAKCFDLNVA